MNRYMPVMIECLLLGVMFFLISVSEVRAQERGAAPCTCSDVSNIKRRIEEADVAVDVYNSELDFINSGVSLETQQLDRFTESSFTNFQIMVLGKIFAARYFEPGVNLGTVSGHLYPSVTFPDCSMEFSQTASPCMLALLNEHEKVHSDSCARLRSLGTPMPYQYNMSKSFVINEEIAAYTREKVFARNLLTHLQSCPGIAQPEFQVPNLRRALDYIGDSMFMDDLSVE